MARTGEDRIWTVPNVISIVRILLVPLFAVLLFQNHNFLAFCIFLIASISDGIDGFIARHFNQTTNLGKILDPIADRLLLLVGSIVLAVIGRLPIWILVLVLIRDLTFLLGGLYLMKTCEFRPKVIMLGKVATTFFYIGFAMLVLAWPWGSGLGLFNLSWLPGFGTDIFFYGIWPVYIGVFLNIFTSTFYVKKAMDVFLEHKRARN